MFSSVKSLNNCWSIYGDMDKINEVQVNVSYVLKIFTANKKHTYLGPNKI